MRRKFKFSKRQRRIIGALADTMCPGGGPFSAGASDFQLADRIEAWAGEIDPNYARGLGLLLYAFNLGTFVLALRPHTFVGLDLARRRAYLESCEDSRFYWRRGMFMALKFLVMTFYYSEPLVEREIGYRLDCTTVIPFIYEEQAGD